MGNSQFDRINNLNTIDSAAADDLLLAWDTSGGATRSMSVAVLQAYLNASALNPLPAAYSLDAQNRVAGPVALPAAAVTYILPTIASEQGAPSYNAATGTFTTPFDGVYEFILTANVDVPTGNRAVYLGIKYFNGTVYVPSQYGCRSASVRNNEIGQATFSGTLKFPKNTKIQFDVWCDATVNVKTNVLAGSSGAYTAVAARLLLTGIETE
jgi:hypothetical protein